MNCKIISTKKENNEYIVYNMKSLPIQSSHIKHKQVVGVSSSGYPILMIVTHGGLYAWFTQNKHGEVEVLATAPHPAIGIWMAERKDPNLKWYDNIQYGSANDDERFTKLYRALYAPSISRVTKSTKKNQSQFNDLFIVYDPDTQRIGLFDNVSVIDGIKIQLLPAYSYIRPITLDTSVTLLKTHPLFAVYFDDEVSKDGK